ncbi:MAG: DUF397 domain-containing protein [Actinomadura sp.]
MPSPRIDDSALAWRKSSRSSGDGPECVEIASLGAAVAVRDSTNPEGPRLAFSSAEWHAFARGIKAGDHDL